MVESSIVSRSSFSDAKVGSASSRAARSLRNSSNGGNRACRSPPERWIQSPGHSSAVKVRFSRAGACRRLQVVEGTAFAGLADLPLNPVLGPHVGGLLLSHPSPPTPDNAGTRASYPQAAHGPATAELDSPGDCGPETTESPALSVTGDAALDVLHRVFGYDAFRGSQREIVDQVIGGGDAWC